MSAALEQALITRYGMLGRVQEPFLLRSDNGLVFTSHDYTQLVRSHGLKQEFIIPHCPQQNGMEGVIRTSSNVGTYHLGPVFTCMRATSLKEVFALVIPELAFGPYLLERVKGISVNQYDRQHAVSLKQYLLTHQPLHCANCAKRRQK